MVTELQKQRREYVINKYVEKQERSGVEMVCYLCSDEFLSAIEEARE
jgi:hypothetical protein